MRGNSFSFLLLALLLPFFVAAQNGGRLSGNLQASGNFFMQDSLIGAAGTPQYDRQLFGAEAWLNLNYSNWGFDFGLRFDMFNNSNILNPLGSYNAQGIGRWYIRKKIQNLDITGGYIYDQIGSGIIFRAYEERPLLIDNALLGVRLAYDLGENWKIRAFTGKTKQQFDEYRSVVKGGALDGYLTLGDSLKPVTLSPGIGVINRTLDDETMQTLVGTLGTYHPADRIGAKYNVYAFSAYNTLTYGNFTWFFEGAYKTNEVIFDPFAPKTNFKTEPDGSIGLDTTLGKFDFRDGSIVYTTMSWAGGGFGITGEFKRTENFSLRASPFLRTEKLNDGLLNFLPPLTRINTYRLTARYNAATQEIGELAYQFDVRYAPSRKLSFNVNYSDIKDLDNVQLYREIYTEVQFKKGRQWQILGGLQLQQYNQERFETKPNVPMVKTITPYFDFLYKINRKKAIRLEGQYMNTKEDYGSWLFALAEFSIAPHWTFTASDMYNVSPGKNSPVDDSGEKLKLHYPRFDVFYTHGANRFSLSYIKQVEGVVCSGGICRLEPAFHGVRLTVDSTF
ncbi:MAG: hypothetical protein KDC24_00800 [Saprospiraceae bacterium]|nr:hypothetical protein [Saprospiraceae bacterium]